MLKFQALSIIVLYKYFKIKNIKDMSTLTELIKESLEGKLADQIRASVEAEGNEMNESVIDFDFSKPLDDSSYKTFVNCVKNALKHSSSKFTLIELSSNREIDEDISNRPNGVYVYMAANGVRRDTDFDTMHSSILIEVVAKNSKNMIVSCSGFINYKTYDVSNKAPNMFYDRNDIDDPNGRILEFDTTWGYSGVELIYTDLPTKS